MPKVTLMYTLKVFLTEESLIELEDSYVDKEDELHKFMFNTIKSLAKQAKMVLRNKQFIVNLKAHDDGTPNTETIKLKEFDLKKYTIKSDDTWIPENFDMEDCKPYKIKVGPKTMDRLQLYCQILHTQISLYNDSLSDADLKVKGRKAKLADCFEQIIHEALIGNVMNKLDQLDSEELDKEFEEVNNPDKKKQESRRGKPLAPEIKA